MDRQPRELILALRNASRSVAWGHTIGELDAHTSALREGPLSIVDPLERSARSTERADPVALMAHAALDEFHRLAEFAREAWVEEMLAGVRATAAPFRPTTPQETALHRLFAPRPGCA